MHNKTIHVLNKITLICTIKFADELHEYFNSNYNNATVCNR